MNVKNTLCIRALTTEEHAYLLHWRVRVPYVVYFNTSTDCALNCLGQVFVSKDARKVRSKQAYDTLKRNVISSCRAH